MNKVKLLGLVLAGLGWAGCGANEQPQAAAALWQQLQQQKYRSWAPVPGFAKLQPAQQPFDNPADRRPLMVKIYMNAVVRSALARKQPMSQWPIGSVFAKDAYQGRDLRAIVVMQKRAEGWFWVQWSGDGEATHSGQPDECLRCHQKGADDDFTLALKLPR